MNEEQLENRCLEWFRDIGWEVVYGPDIVPDGDNPMRSDYRNILLEADLEASFARINPHFLPQRPSHARQRRQAAGQFRNDLFQ